MSTSWDLRLHQEALLLALKDDSGTPAPSMYAFAVGGAILAELLLDGRLSLVERRRREPLVEVVPGAAPTGDRVLDEAVRRVRDAKRRASTSTWIGRFADRSRVRETAQSLVHMGILRSEEKSFLLLFRRTVYPELDPAPERRLVERLRDAVLGDEPVDDRTAALVGIAHAAGMLGAAMGRGELKKRKERIKALAEGSAAARATQAAVQAVHAAIAAVVATSAAT